MDYEIGVVTDEFLLIRILFLLLETKWTKPKKKKMKSSLKKKKILIHYKFFKNLNK